MNKINIGIIGGAGYTGGELLRILVNHPAAHIAFIHSKSNAGQPVSKVHADLAGDIPLRFSDSMDMTVDLLFLCAGHGEGKKFMQENDVPATVRIIDLSNDFRLAAHAQTNGRTFVYGLPELNREKIRGHRDIDIANPGCFASAIQLGLLPLAQAGMLSTVQVTGITGSTGAGQSLSATSHFSWRANNIQAYKTLTHQHLGEIGESLRSFHPDRDLEINFIPWRGDFTRGIYVSTMVELEWSEEDIFRRYEQFYEGHPFTHVSREAIALKQVVNTNKCLVQPEKVGNKLVIHSAIDNLLKGASGQAVQNMNLMFGLEESEGLRLKANYF